MTRLLASALLLGVCLQPAFAQESLSLPADAKLQVQVLNDKMIKAGEKASHVLLKPVQTGDKMLLPDYCLMSANAAIAKTRVELSVTRVLCVNENRDYYEGVLKGSVLGSDGKVGLKTSCVSNSNGSCQKAKLEILDRYTLRIEEAADIPLVVNQSEQINIKRRQAEPEFQ